METTATAASKVRSLRMSDTTYDAVKEICKSFANSDAALSALVAAYDVQKSREVLTNRETEIADFSAHVSALQSAFVRSLEICENADNRIRAEYQDALASKDRALADYQRRADAAERAAADAAARADAAERELAAAAIRADAAERAAADAVAIIEDKKQIIDSLAAKLAQVDEIAARAARADEIAAERDKLKAALDAAEKDAAIEKERSYLAVQRAIVQERADNQDKVAALMEEVGALRQRVSELTILTSEAARSARPRKKAAGDASPAAG